MRPLILAGILLAFAVANVKIDIASRPYYFRNDQHGSTKSLEEIRNILKSQGGRARNTLNVEYEIFKVATNDKDSVNATYELHQIATDYDGKLVNGKFIRLHNPLNHFSILEPKDGCNAYKTYTVLDTVTSIPKYRRCRVATNAGFFNTHTFTCLGNLISDGNKIQSERPHNSQFGITKKGDYYVGYLTTDTPKANGDEFIQLISGAIWLVRNGELYVSQSAQIEDMTIQESGQNFVNLRASRIGLGHNEKGQLIIVEFDGDGNHQKGPNLYELGQIMIKLGAVNAINLDGGGSTTVLHNDILVNTISDGCPKIAGEPILSNLQRCARKVTSVTCIHDLWLDDTTSIPTTSTSGDFSFAANCTREYEHTKTLLAMATLGLGGLGTMILAALVLFTCAFCSRSVSKQALDGRILVANTDDSESDEDTTDIPDTVNAEQLNAVYGQIELQEVAVQPRE